MPLIFDRPLFVGAHVDDIELFAGALLAKTAMTARVLVFSHHESVIPSPHRELKMSMGVVDIGPARFAAYELPACNGSFQERRDFIYMQLEAERTVFQPTCVITHQSNDTNQDHQQVFAEVLRVFKKKVSIIGGCFPHDDMLSSTKNLFVPCTAGNLAKKMSMLQCYKSQTAPNRPYMYTEYWYAYMRAWGYECGAEFAEKFEVIQLILE